MFVTLPLALVFLAGAVLVARDFVASRQFNPAPLCVRSDGSTWRSASGCGSADDPRCAEDDCGGSRFVAEKARQADTWILFHASVPASGEPPYFAGPHPGSGRYDD